MSPEELASAIHSADSERCVKLIIAATESERRACAKTAEALRKQAWKQYTSPAMFSQGAKMDTPYAMYQTACVAVMGTGTLSEIKRATGVTANAMGWMYEILTARRPDWLADWVEWTLEQGVVPQFGRPNNWTVVRRLMRDGIIGEPSTDAYISGMVCGVSFRDPIKPILLADPTLLDREVWRLFEVEGSRDSSLAGHDKYLSSWAAALLELCEEDKLDRQRLLTASLEALQRDFQPFHAGWYSRFHEALKPTLEERTARTDTYLALVASRVPPTVSFALKALEILDKDEAVSPTDLLAALPPALSAREKGTALQAIKLLNRIATRDAALTNQTVHAAAEGLMHAAVDVQVKAMDIIQKYGDLADPLLRDALAARREDLAPSLRQRFEALLGEPVEPVESTPGSALDIEELINRAANLDQHWSRIAGVAEALEDYRAGKLTTCGLQLDPLTIPRLDPADSITPIADLDTLIGTFLSVIENYGPADDIERVLDGVSRLCAERPADFDRRTSALKKRALTLTKGLVETGHAGHIATSLCGLALAWIEGVPLEPASRDISLRSFFHQRIVEVAYRAARHEPAQLLSAPTHRGGWLDPRVAVQRFIDISSEQNANRAGTNSPSFLARLLKLNAQPLLEANSVRFDVIQALLRLTPDGRPDALATASAVKGEIGEALRYALGGEAREIGQDEALWIAACRVRNPQGDDMQVERRFPRRGPGAGRAGHLSIEWIGIDPRAKLRCDPPIPSNPRLDEPTVLHYAWVGYWHSSVSHAGSMVSNLSTIWPLGRHVWLAHGARAIGSNLDWWEASWGDSMYLHLLADLDTGLCGHGIDLLVLGLAAKEPGQHGAATDVLIAAISDGRVTWNELGEAMARAIINEKVTPARWAKTLADASRVSPLHLVTIRKAIESALAVKPARKPAAMVALLSLTLELCIESRLPISNSGALEYLNGITGSGKAAALAKSLRAQELAGGEMTKAAAYLALQSRIERAEQWTAFS